MNRSKKTTLALFALLGTATIVNAQDYDTDMATDYGEASVANEPATSATEYVRSWAAEAFWATSDTTFWGKHMDMGGLNFRYYIRQRSPADTAQSLSPEFFLHAGAGLGGGSCGSGGYGDHRDDAAYTFVHFIGMMGANLRYNINERFSLYIGARMGLDWLYFDADTGYVDEDNSKDNGNDLGWIYGFGLGADVAFTKNFSLSLGVEHLNSSAQPKVWGAEIPKQEYLVYSVGVKFAF